MGQLNSQVNAMCPTSDGMLCIDSFHVVKDVQTAKEKFVTYNARLKFVISQM